jgi:phage baseplate assembly protein W
MQEFIRTKIPEFKNYGSSLWRVVENAMVPTIYEKLYGIFKARVRNFLGIFTKME